LKFEIFNTTSSRGINDEATPLSCHSWSQARNPSNSPRHPEPASRPASPNRGEQGGLASGSHYCSRYSRTTLYIFCHFCQPIRQAQDKLSWRTCLPSRQETAARYSVTGPGLMSRKVLKAWPCNKTSLPPKVDRRCILQVAEGETCGLY
jgi:hypothetical protein